MYLRAMAQKAAPAIKTPAVKTPAIKTTDDSVDLAYNKFKAPRLRIPFRWAQEHHYVAFKKLDATTTWELNGLNKKERLLLEAKAANAPNPFVTFRPKYEVEAMAFTPVGEYAIPAGYCEVEQHTRLYIGAPVTFSKSDSTFT
jgi:hypothetical protein